MQDLGLKKQKGFTLIEILVAMFLMTFVLLISIGNPFSSHDALIETLENIERGVRFSVDESALRNSIVRMHFFLDNEEEQEYTIEYGPNENFILPLSPFNYTGVLSIRDKERREKENKELNSKFNKIQEFQEGNKKLPSGIRLIGIGTSLYKSLITEFEASFYIYPTGEKDNAIIILGSDEELATLTVDAFTMDININFHPLTEDLADDDLLESQLELAEELFKAWLKEN